MKTLTCLVLGLALTMLAGNARAADDLTGTWDVTIEIAGQTGSPTFHLEQDGDKLKDKYKGQFGEADVTGTVKDKDVEIRFDLQEGATVVYTGKVQDDGTLKGTADYAGQAEGDWTAKKKVSDESR